MPVLALSVVDVLLFLGLGLAGFVVVALVCAAVLAMLHAVLPSTDAGAAEVDAAEAQAGGDPGSEPAPAPDKEQEPDPQT